MKLRVVIIVLCCLSYIFTFAQSPASRSKTRTVTLFTVNKKPVSAEEFVYLYRKNHQNPSQDYTREKIEEYLSLYINFKLKVEEARARGMDTTVAFKREFNQYKDELRKPYMPGNGLADSLARLTYDRMKEEIRASHILVSLAPEASPEDTVRAYNRIVSLRDRVMNGEPFEKVAAASSEDPSAKANNGDLGYFSALQMVYPFENAAYSTPVGQISKPFRTRFGYHILRVYDRRATLPEVEVSHIMIRTGEERDEKEARDKIFAVFDELQAGRSWADLCREHSDDAGTKNNGGKLRPFRAGMMSNVPEFEQVALQLEKAGQLSDPFQTQYGWHIVRLERQIPLGSYEEMALNLKNRISRDERTQISKQALQLKLRNNFGFRETTPVKEALDKMPDSTLRNGKWRKALATSQLTAVLFELGQKRYRVNEFLSYADKNAQDGTLMQQYGKYVDESVMQLQEEKIIAENPEYRFLMNEYYEGILLFEIMEKEVWNRASQDSAGQYAYYQTHADAYTAGARAKASLYTAADPVLLSSLKEKLEDNAGSIQDYLSANKIKTESGYFKKEDKAVFQRIPWETGLHQAENNGLYYLAWLKEVLPAGRMSFEEARPELISDYQNHLEKEWVSLLKKKYPLKVSASGKKYVISVLEKR